MPGLPGQNVTVDLYIDGYVFHVNAIVTGLTKMHGILGMNFLSDMFCVNCYKRTGKDGIVMKQHKLENRLYNVEVVEDTTLYPSQWQVVKCIIHKGTLDDNACCYVVEPADDILKTSGLFCPAAVMNVSDDFVLVTANNVGNNNRLLQKGHRIATVSIAEDATMIEDLLHDGGNVDDCIPDFLQPLFDDATKDLSKDEAKLWAENSLNLVKNLEKLLWLNIE